MRPVISGIASPWVQALAIVLAGAIPAAAQSRPASPSSSTAASSARSWSGYRPGAAWQGRVPGLATAGAATVRRQEHAAVAGTSQARRGWAGYAPATAWSGYRPGTVWQSYTPAAGRPIRMNHAHVPGPSPYADGLARSYHEYGTGRPVPLAKPWLPGSP